MFIKENNNLDYDNGGNSTLFDNGGNSTHFDNGGNSTHLDNGGNSTHIDNGGHSTHYNDYDYYYDDIEKPLFVNILQWFENAFLLPVGLLGNLLVIVILSKKKYRDSSTAVLFTFLAISDIIVLLGSALAQGPADVVLCKISVFLAFSSAQLSSCTLALVAVERSVMVLIPHRAKFIFSARNARIVICALYVLILGMNVTALHSFDTDFEFCIPIGDLQDYFDNIFPWIDFCLAFALPFIIILASSVIIITKVRSNNLSKKSTRGKFPSFTKVLLSTNICFLVTQSPLVIHMIADPEATFDGFDTFPFRFFITLALMNSAANFFLYFLNAPIFRTDVSQLLCRFKDEGSNTR